MPLSLHAALIPTYQQMLGALGGLIAKAENWCAERGCDASALIEARLADDMFPFGYQVQSCWVHSAFAIERCSEGTFSPYRAPWPGNFAGLQEIVAQAQDTLARTSEADLEQLAGEEIVFSVGEQFRREFTVQDFLLSFSQPNFYFHAATAYAIMRKEGVPIGKRDYMGTYRAKG